jgi:hypothetical protein
MSSEFQFYSDSPSKAAVPQPSDEKELIKANWESATTPTSGTPIEKTVGQAKSQVHHYHCCTLLKNL